MLYCTVQAVLDIFLSSKIKKIPDCQMLYCTVQAELDIFCSWEIKKMYTF